MLLLKQASNQAGPAAERKPDAIMREAADLALAPSPPVNQVNTFILNILFNVCLLAFKWTKNIHEQVSQGGQGFAASAPPALSIESNALAQLQVLLT